MPTVTYEDIWWGFSETCSYALAFFNPLFDGLNMITKPIRVVGPFTQNPPGDIRNRNHFWISYSGEPFQQSTKTGFYNAHLIMEPTDLSKNIICTPLFSLYAYEQDAWPKLMMPRELLIKKKFCAMIVSEGRGEVRNRFFHKLNSIKKIDSMGRWLNNVDFVLPRGEEKSPDVLGEYKFVMCFENTIKSHYMTEKLLHAYLTGAIPIYGGASFSREILNPNAFLYLEDTSDSGMDKLIQQILYLDQNDDAYRTMHSQPLLREPCIPKELSIEYYQECLKHIYNHNK